MILGAVVYGPMEVELRPARPHRHWMDAFPDRHPYRCLPLAIANVFGWEMLSPCDLRIDWNGGERVEDLTVSAEDGYDLLGHFAASNFSRGIVTMHAGFIFRTEPGWSLLATGPLNDPRDGISPLAGVIETDWLPYPFTMNWQLTRPGTVRFARGEPFCHIVPVRHEPLTETEVRIITLDDEEGLRERHDAFARRRTELRARQSAPEPGETPPAWLREYFRGELADGLVAPRHLHKLRLADPIDTRPGAKPREAPVPSSPRAERAMRAGPGEAPSAIPTTSPVRTAEGLWWTGDPMSLPVCEPSEATKDMVVVEDFLNADQCEALIAAFEETIAGIPTNDGGGFWDGRILFLHQIADTGAKAIMQQSRFAALYRIARHFNVETLPYSDTQQLVRWPTGLAMPPHVDNAHPDGSQHETAYREFASVVYLNDDFEGGDIYFPTLGYRLRARRGMLIGFRADALHPHGITEITAGLRYTMPGWYTSDATRAEPSMLSVF